MIKRYGEPRTEEIVRGWVANQPTLINGDTKILEAIAAGQCDVGADQHLLPGAPRGQGRRASRWRLLGEPGDDGDARQHLGRRRDRPRQEPRERRSSSSSSSPAPRPSRCSPTSVRVSRPTRRPRVECHRRQVGQVQAGRHQRRRRRGVPGGGDQARRPRRLQVSPAPHGPPGRGPGRSRRGPRRRGPAPRSPSRRRLGGCPSLAVVSSLTPAGPGACGRTSGAPSSSSWRSTRSPSSPASAWGRSCSAPRSAWLVVHRTSSPGRRALRVGADPAAGAAGLRDRLRVARALRVRRGRCRRRCATGSARARALPDLRSYWGVVLVMTLVFYPYVYLLARAAFREQGAGHAGDGADAGPLALAGVPVDVTLPMARPSLVAGAALAMMEALADFGTVATFGYRTLTEAIYRVWYGMFDRMAATQLADAAAGASRWPARCSSGLRAAAPASPRAGAARPGRPGASAGRRAARGHGRCAPACSALAFVAAGRPARWCGPLEAARLGSVPAGSARLGPEPRARRRRGRRGRRRRGPPAGLRAPAASDPARGARRPALAGWATRCRARSSRWACSFRWPGSTTPWRRRSARLLGRPASLVHRLGRRASSSPTWCASSR